MNGLRQVLDRSSEPGGSRAVSHPGHADRRISKLISRSGVKKMSDLLSVVIFALVKTVVHSQVLDDHRALIVVASLRA
nr:hypothetical protein Itr_chr09CG12570 [Ipomoea trifida]